MTHYNFVYSNMFFEINFLYLVLLHINENIQTLIKHLYYLFYSYIYPTIIIGYSQDIADILYFYLKNKSLNNILRLEKYLVH